MDDATGSPSSTTDDAYPSAYPRVFWVLLVMGWIVIGVGLRGLLVNADSRMGTDPPGWIALMVKSNLAHDFVLIPVVLGIGLVVARLVPARIRSAVQSGLIVSGVVVLYAFPFVRGYGRSSSNPTILPQDYVRGLLLVLAAVWSVTALVAVLMWRRAPADASTEDRSS